MSLFKKPKKSLQNRRMFSSEIENMEVDDGEPAEPKKRDKKDKEKEKAVKPQKSSLLSFGDEGIYTIANVVAGWPQVWRAQHQKYV